MNFVPMKVAARVKAIKKRINDEPGFQVDRVLLHGDLPYYVFRMQVGQILVYHWFNIAEDAPRPDDVVASLRDEYEYAFD